MSHVPNYFTTINIRRFKNNNNNFIILLLIPFNSNPYNLIIVHL